MALVGASPRNDTARILRDNITRLGAATRPYLVNPNYHEIDGLACYPDLAALPGGARRRRGPGESTPRRWGGPRGRERRRARGDRSRWRHHRRRRAGGTDAGRGRCHRDRIRHRPRGSELHGCGRFPRAQWDLHRRPAGGTPARRHGRDRAVGEHRQRVRQRRPEDRLEPDHQLRLRGRAGRVRLPRRVPRRPGDRFGRPVRRGVQAPRAIPRPRRPRAGDGRAGPRREGRAESPGAGRRDLALGLAGRRRARDRGGNARGGGRVVRRRGRAPRSGGARQRVAAPRPAGGAGEDRPRHGLDGRGIAHRGSRAGPRPGAAADPGRRPRRDRRRHADADAPREPDRPVGRGRGGADVPSHLRRARGLRGVRRGRPRARLPVRLGGQRDRTGRGARHRARGRDGRPARRAAGIRLAHVGRRNAGGREPDGRGGRRAHPAGHRERARRHPQARLVGGSARGTPPAWPGACRLARDRGAHTVLRSR